jgi:hypothetical protein
MTRIFSLETQAIVDAHSDYHHYQDIPLSIAAVLREVVNQLQYYNCLEGEDMLLDARAVLDIADELEAL